MRNFSRFRDLQPELMDNPQISTKEHERALDGLARLNRFSIIDRTVWRVIKTYSDTEPLRILDIAAGSGDLLIKLAKRAKQSGTEVKFTACDISGFAVRLTKERAESAGLDIRTIQTDITKEPIEETYDIVMCHLFLHHLDESEIITLLTKMRNSATKAVIITDLMRTKTGYALAYFGSRLLTRSHVVHVDALHSVRAALTPEELHALVLKAAYLNATMKRIWPERMLLRCNV